MTSAATTSNDPIIAQANLTLLDAIQRVALSQMHTNSPDAQSEPISHERDISADHWVASVLLDINKAQIYFRVHFSTATSRKLLAQQLHVDAKNFEAITSHDQMKEFCNVVMGRIKGMLSAELDKESTSKVFLPKVDPSYDNFSKIPTPGSGAVYDQRWWRISWTDGELILFARVKSQSGFGAETMKSLANEQIILMDNDGEIEML